MAYLQIALGLVFLFAGGELLVRGAVGLARRLGVSPLLVGGTVVAFGTSAPELAVAVSASLSAHPAIAVGAVIGSNLANVLLILALSALVFPIGWSRRRMLRDAAGLAFASLVFVCLAADALLSRVEGLVLVALLAGLTALHTYRDRLKQETTLHLLQQEAAELVPPARLRRSAVETGLGLLAVAVGADQLVVGASEAARAFGISEATIGVSLVAVGTSLPELAACLVASWRRHSELALGNVIGSNVFNQLGIAGTAALMAPMPIPRELLRWDLWWMFAVMLGMCGLLVGRGHLGRLPAALCLAAYAGWLVVRS